MLQYKRIGVTVKSGLTYKNESVSKVLTILTDLGAVIYTDPTRLSDVDCSKDFAQFHSEDDIDLLVVIGGDGTILRAIRELRTFKTPILSVNRGTVGFLAETEIADADTIIPRLLTGEGVLENRSILSVVATRGTKNVFEGFALNEAVIAQGTIARLVDLRTMVNGEDLTSYHADGLIIATPTGSTAYSLAAGGPIVHPTLAATILTPINPHSFSQKPVVIPSNQKVTVEVMTKSNKFKDTEVVLTVDGQVYVPLENGDKVTACACGDTVKFLRLKQDTFFHTLREKLKWGERVD
ncbi:NAD(+) kinase [Candidatus Peregrinibacteria bacterium CG10_big_fil_rev_8_21_14_0_10_49_24]|nr:MAG: NAD(+) kinase [Candidatus Peregrinibacteria bacterium CG11_big_fil_rev_8_21_14_0_20_49_14]PIR50965.1 MAG: NAD(+) kinase [Candidatus Peregrinibacteria bacterium CG10_big_fil_rev_8_21_14_0_10_49_24]PJA67518.1 MAG: NAD(+) kinase [Candidatus Peregrinibacteria bacterium CG_4_9_14_3_um_filter_49_12]